MRQTLLSALAALSLAALASDTFAQGILYRCESADGISIQGVPCPKGVSQRKIAVQRPVDPVPSPIPTSTEGPGTAPAAAATRPSTPSSAMHGPNQPYPLWQCMRADGSTFDSRTGIPGKQWVPKTDPASTDPDAGQPTSTPAQIAARPKLHDHVVRPYSEVATTDDQPAVDATPPPAGAAPGQWVADECTQLTPEQACDRFASRRDALRKQIYAAKPSERATYAPEEQDLSSMLYAACGR